MYASLVCTIAARRTAKERTAAVSNASAASTVAAARAGATGSTAGTAAQTTALSSIPSVPAVVAAAHSPFQSSIADQPSTFGANTAAGTAAITAAITAAGTAAAAFAAAALAAARQPRLSLLVRSYCGLYRLWRRLVLRRRQCACGAAQPVFGRRGCCDHRDCS